MRFSSFGLMAGLAATSMAQDLLFLDTLDYNEYDEAIALGFTAQKVTVDQWNAMTTADFAKYKAIVIADPDCGSVDSIKFLEDTRNVWSPAVTGNIVLIGTDPTFHFSNDGAKTLIDNSIKFAAAGTTPAGVPQTGLYFALSCYYQDVDTAKVEALSWFGDFTVRGNLDCYNKVHLVAHSDAMDSLTDDALSGWSCSVHEAFASYPSVGTNGFQAMAIAQDILGVGSQTFGDGTVGLPYVISRGATPAKCGDGVWDKDLGEECDDGNDKNGDGCSLSCKCESGKPKGDGTCFPSNTTTPAGPTGGHSTPYPSSSPTVYPSPVGGHSYPYGNSSATPTYVNPGYPSASAVYTPPPYVTPACPTGPKIIGVEYIVEVTYSSSSYVPCSTKQRPIYDAPTSVLPCYVCAMSTDSVTYTSTDFVTVVTTTCPYAHPTETAIPTYTPVVYPCKSCSAHTFTETECITTSEYVHYYTEYPAVPYVTPTPHDHYGTVTHHSYEHKPETVYTNYSPAGYTHTYGYPPSVITYATPTPTGTAKYYPTETVAMYTGAAKMNKEAKAAGVVGGALLAVAALL